MSWRRAHTAQDRAAVLAYRGIAVAVARAGIETERRRMVAVYLLVTFCNVPGEVAARAAAITKQAVSKACRRIEDLRDDPAFEDRLAALEDALAGEP